MLDEVWLAHELSEGPRPQARLVGLLLDDGGRIDLALSGGTAVEELLACGANRLERTRSAWRSASSTLAVSSSWSMARRTSSLV